MDGFGVERKSSQREGRTRREKRGTDWVGVSVVWHPKLFFWWGCIGPLPIGRKEETVAATAAEAEADASGPLVQRSLQRAPGCECGLLVDRWGATAPMVAGDWMRVLTLGLFGRGISGGCVPLVLDSGFSIIVTALWGHLGGVLAGLQRSHRCVTGNRGVQLQRIMAASPAGLPLKEA